MSARRIEKNAFNNFMLKALFGVGYFGYVEAPIRTGCG
jgi:hypothetical protein